MSAARLDIEEVFLDVGAQPGADGLIRYQINRAFQQALKFEGKVYHLIPHRSTELYQDIDVAIGFCIPSDP